MRNISLFIGLLLLSGCVAETYLHGYTFEQSDITQITAGKSTEEDVVREFGSPTSKSDFGPKTYYYISYKTERVAFLDPRIIEQEIISIEFDKRSIVHKISTYILDDRNQIAFSEDQIEMEGNEITPLGQILSNVGKFNKIKKGN